jgi:hypothetical protein
MVGHLFEGSAERQPRSRYSAIRAYQVMRGGLEAERNDLAGNRTAFFSRRPAALAILTFGNDDTHHRRDGYAWTWPVGNCWMVTALIVSA